jgi:hypothetical protein
MSGPRYSYPSLTPMYGLGSGNRVIGAIGISSPRTKIGSAGRVYANVKRHIGTYAALEYMHAYTGLGPYSIQNGKLVYN